MYIYACVCIYTINSKINGTPQRCLLTHSKLHSILAIVNLLAHNNSYLWFGYVIMDK